MSLSVSPHNSELLQGGTQDNGTWENKGQVATWVNTMIGDGGQSGFDVARPEFRFHTFFDAAPDVNFNNGNIARLDLDGRPDLREPRHPVLRAGHQRPEGQRHDVRRHRRSA